MSPSAGYARSSKSTVPLRASSRFAGWASGWRTALRPWWGLDHAQGKHRVGHLDEAGDARTDHVVPGGAVLLGRGGAPLVDVSDDLGQTFFGVREGPRAGARLPRELRGRCEHLQLHPGGRRDACPGRDLGPTTASGPSSNRKPTPRTVTTREGELCSSSFWRSRPTVTSRVFVEPCQLRSHTWSIRRPLVTTLPRSSHNNARTSNSLVVRATSVCSTQTR